MTQDAAQARKGTGLSVAGWPLGRKMALALAIPLLLAAVLGGLRVAGDYGDSRQAARSAQQVTIIQPAVDYLTASESAMVAAQSDSAASQGDLIDAISDISTNAETLVEARDGAELDELQTAHVNALLDLSQAMRGEGAETLGPATWIALVRQLESSVSQLITSVNAAQETPEPRLEQLSQAMSGRLSLALQQGLLATTLSQSSSQELSPDPSRARTNRPPSCASRTPATPGRSATTLPPTSTDATPTRRTTRSPRRSSPV